MVGLHDVWIIRRVAIHILSYLVLDPNMWTHLVPMAEVFNGGDGGDDGVPMPPRPSPSLQRWIRMRRLLVRALGDDTCPGGPLPTLTNQMLWPYRLEPSPHRHARQWIDRLCFRQVNCLPCGVGPQPRGFPATCAR